MSYVLFSYLPTCAPSSFFTYFLSFFFILLPYQLLFTHISFFHTYAPLNFPAFFLFFLALFLFLNVFFFLSIYLSLTFSLTYSHFFFLPFFLSIHQSYSLNDLLVHTSQCLFSLSFLRACLLTVFLCALQLPGVEACQNYQFRYGRHPLMELPLMINPSGSARSEPKVPTQCKR